MNKPVALITGARRGIGRCIAELFAQDGYDLAVADLDAGRELAACVQACRDAGARAQAFALDIAALDTHAVLLDAVEAQIGNIECLINNAGVSVISRGDLLDVSPESFDRCVAVNTRGTFFLTQAVAKRMLARPPLKDRHRSVITVTSANAVAASVQRGEYCVSKAALSMASRLLQFDCPPIRSACMSCNPA